MAHARSHHGKLPAAWVEHPIPICTTFLAETEVDVLQTVLWAGPTIGMRAEGAMSQMGSEYADRPEPDDPVDAAASGKDIASRRSEMTPALWP